MAQPLVSGSWYRVEALKPSLVAGLRIVRHRVRDQLWHVLVEPGSGRQLRLNPAAYAFAGRCDGRQTVGEIWQLLLARGGDDAPTQDDVLRLLAQLFRAGMLHFDAAPHLSLLFARRAEDEQQRRRAFVNPLMLRTRLFDPSRLLDRLAPLAEALAHWPVFVLWAVAVVAAALACAAHFPALQAEALRVLATPSSYALAWVAYPLVKSLHELGHALAVRRFGGAVHEVGVSLMFLTPAPYVDASAANAFGSARQRAAVSAAGVVVELALAALAAFAWLAFTPGIARDAALVVLLICSVSTLAFNANPLVRLDGYHLLCDLLQLPNLALRSQAWWASRWRRLLGAEAPLPASALAAGEAKWLAFYAPASWAYRLGLLLALVFWVGQHSWLLGWLVALGLAGWLLAGMVRGFLRTAASAPDAAARRRALQLAAGTLAAAAVLLFVVPAPASVVARGVVWPPEHAQLRPQAGGFVEATLVAGGASVRAGEVVMQLSDPALVAAREKAWGERTGLLAQQYTALLNDPARAGDAQVQIERNTAELERAEQQLAELDLRAHASGRTVWAREADLPGSYAKRGAMLGYVLAPEPAQVRVVLQDEDMLRVRGQVRAIEVRLAGAPFTAHAATLASETPAATQQLPSAALADRHGGPVPVDPADRDALRTQKPVFLLDVVVPDVPAGHVGGRAWVKLQLEPQPVGWQAVRALRQLLLRQFNPTGQA
ncbi:PqqD family peptide modification chaperone [Ramlibacter sp. USB13]|uniref:PqqD family peptide modification chaperone n=1 Tax=Ramlibacter cellulosilyticus TaxID=2764187 RepID=A0A923MQ34_9BURK|nr:PqqD family peptide modification chaperone [Ramlibacter cellulosilyticus]MBC5783737.1 PqqD family peptide modification chaperone [Ramlibacter cellulosilyticus]